MARVFQDGFDQNDTTVTRNTWDTWAGATVGVTNVRTGTYAARVSSLVSATAQGAAKKWLSAAANGPYYVRAYIKVVTLPSASNTVLYFSASATLNTTVRCSIKLSSLGKLQLFNATTQVGSDSAAINDSAWHMVELQTDTTHAANHQVVEGRLDGSVFATSAVENQATSLAFAIGGNLLAEAQTLGEWWFDDVALNDTAGTSQTSYPGSGKVITLRPNAAGDVNTFATQTGGTAGAANNFTRVDEFPPDDATTFNGSNTLNQEDLFNMDASGIGASDTVNAVQLNGRFRNSVADLTTAIKFEIEKTTSGTITQSSAIVPDTTSWNTNGTAVPRLSLLTLYADPDAAAWTQTTLDSMQAGYKITAGSTNRIDVSAIWVTVDYTPSSAVPASVAQVAATITATGGTQTVVGLGPSIAITQVAATITAAGGTQTIATVNDVAVSQLAATITASGGTQAIATVNNVALTQLAATITASGGTQTLATVNDVAIAQTAATITATGGLQIIQTATGPLPPRKLYLDTDANLYLVINQSAGLLERV